MLIDPRIRKRRYRLVIGGAVVTVLAALTVLFAVLWVIAAADKDSLEDELMQAITEITRTEEQLKTARSDLESTTQQLEKTEERLEETEDQLTAAQFQLEVATQSQLGADEQEVMAFLDEVIPDIFGSLDFDELVRRSPLLTETVGLEPMRTTFDFIVDLFGPLEEYEVVSIGPSVDNALATHASILGVFEKRPGTIEIEMITVDNEWQIVGWEVNVS